MDMPKTIWAEYEAFTDFGPSEWWNEDPEQIEAEVSAKYHRADTVHLRTESIRLDELRDMLGLKTNTELTRNT